MRTKRINETRASGARCGVGLHLHPTPPHHHHPPPTPARGLFPVPFHTPSRSQQAILIVFSANGGQLVRTQLVPWCNGQHSGL